MNPSKWSKDLHKILLDATKYSGSRKPGEKIISASSLGKELFFNLMQFKFGNNEQAVYGPNTIGSIYQIGLDTILMAHNEKEPGRYTVAKRFKHVIANGWTVSGELDIMDNLERVIIDGKVLSDTGWKKATKAGQSSDYNVQVGTYKWMEALESGKEPCTGALHAINKAGSVAKKNLLSHCELDTYDGESIEFLFIERTNAMQVHIDNDTFPSPDEEGACDIWKYGKAPGGPNRCINFCDYKSVCPRHNANGYKREVNTLMSLGKNPQKKESRQINTEINFG